MILPRFSRALLACALAAGAGLPVFSASADELPIRIEHAPVARATRGKPVKLEARITSTNGRKVVETFAYLRLKGLDGFVRVPLRPSPTDRALFAGEIPAEQVSSDFDYFVEAYDEDGNGPMRVGSPEAPNHVPVVDAAAPSAVPTEALSGTVPSPRSMAPAYALLGGGVLSAAVGAGFAMAVRSYSSDFDRAVRENGAFSGADLKAWGRDAAVANVAFGVATACLAGAAVYYFWPESRPAPADESRAAHPQTRSADENE